MYTIYINDKPLILCSDENLPWIAPSGAQILAIRYPGKKRFLHNYIDYMEKNPKENGLIVHADDLEKLWSDFRSCFQWVEAAGGAVFSPQRLLLVMYRMGYWDLPKGKIDPGETPVEAALREVREETGLQTLQIKAPLQPTYHAFDHRDKRYLKMTHWFEMEAPESQTLVPQTEEGIEILRWVRVSEWLADNPKLYQSLRKLIEGLG